MKKILTLCMAVLTAATMFAKSYNASVGLVGGLGLGLQAKMMLTDNFTIMDDLGYFINPNGINGGYSGLINSSVFGYQGRITETKGMKLDWYAGAQVKIGWDPINMGNDYVHLGVFGTGAAGGVEAIMANAPIAVSFDFRPGWAMLFNGQPDGIAHLFDYSFHLGVRYYFGK